MVVHCISQQREIFKKFVYPHGDIFYSLSWQLRSPLAGAAALFVLSLLYPGCVLQVSGIISDG